MNEIAEHVISNIQLVLQMGGTLNEGVMMQCSSFGLSSEAAQKIESIL